MTDPELELEPLDSEWTTRLALDDRGGPARRLSKERALAMVEHALTAAAIAEVGAARGSSERAASTGRSLKWIASAAVVLLALVSGAFAAISYWPARKPKAPAAAAPAALRARIVPPKPTTEAPEVVQVEDEAAAPQLAQEPQAREPRMAPAMHEEPEDLLQAANRLRAQGRFGAASEVYALVYERHPGSIAAYTAEVARATIELEHRGNPQKARALFARALAQHPNGALDIEARQGLALALRDLGDAAAEARALQGLVRVHADSPAAERARARLSELKAQAR